MLERREDMKTWKKYVTALSLAALTAGPLAAGTTATDTAGKDAAGAKVAANAATASKASKDAVKVIDEAIAALKETDTAIKALNDGKNDDATTALERAIGKLEVVLTQHPDMKLAPVDVSSTVIDIIASPRDIRKARAEVLRLLQEDQMQLARPILSELASEVDITTSYLPLDSYPLALKSAAALVKDGKVDDAKKVLARALDTEVSDQIALPLPMLDGALLIADAEKLSAKANRTKAENKKLGDLLDALDMEIAKGEALEYGGPGAFEPLKKEMKAIRRKVASNGSGSGFFDKLKGLFKGLSQSHAAASKTTKGAPGK